MARMVHCIKLGREAEGLDLPPYPGELGKRIYENVSKEAWQAWLRGQLAKKMTELPASGLTEAVLQRNLERWKAQLKQPVSTPKQ